MNEKLFGNTGKVDLPGNTKNDWGTEDTTYFVLADYLPTNQELAEANNLRMVTI